MVMPSTSRLAIAQEALAVIQRDLTGRERVLDPAVVDGQAVWCVSGKPYCQIGHLQRQAAIS